MNRHRRGRGESGFTLVELLVTIVIAGMVLGVITLSVAQGFQATSTANSRLDRSNLADFSARYFGADVADSALSQPPAAPCGGGGSLLDIAESDGSTVSYAVVVSGSGSTLERRDCASGPAAVTQLGSSPQVFAADPSATGCPSGAAARCSLAIHWGNGAGDFTLSGTRRAG